jgi:hypothetical protein
MTVRGGGVPCPPWLQCRLLEWVRRLGAFAADAQGCIMVRVIEPTEYKAAARLFRAPHAGSPSNRHPDTLKPAVVLEAVKAEPRGVAAAEAASLDRSCARRPVLCAGSGRGNGCSRVKRVNQGNWR